MNNDYSNLIKDSASTFLNIAQMTQYRVNTAEFIESASKSSMTLYITSQ